MVSKDTLPIKADERWRAECVRYSICTIVTRLGEYAEMVESFRRGGFCEPDCEYLFLDNSQENMFDSYAGYNLFLNVARGKFIILCHQDVILVDDGRVELDLVLESLSRIDPHWGVCGNSGGVYVGKWARRISDPHGAYQRVGKLPAKARSLDENFIVVRRSANLALSHDLKGFHLYGTDICLIADIIGYQCYVVDFHLLHKSPGNADTAFKNIRESLIKKYHICLRSRWINGTCTIMFVSGAPIFYRIFNKFQVIGLVQFIGRKAPWLSRLLFRT
jgi:hypothetical protein